jgi:sugar diacid utilization regulator
MTSDSGSHATLGALGLDLDEPMLETLRARLPDVSELTIAAVVAEVPGYAGALSGQMGENIEQAVQMALGGFLRLVQHGSAANPGTPLQPALDAAYALGRGEARAGRSMDALLAAYRVGARVSWREMSTTAVEGDLAPATLASFAELVFAYIDELSAASVAGHTDELATTGRVRQRYLERLGQDLLSQASADVLVADAARADWAVPETLTAVLLPTAQVRTVASLLDARTLELSSDLIGLEMEQTAVLLVPDMGGSGRSQLMRVLHERRAVVGPARPWTMASSSYQRALRTYQLVTLAGNEPIDSEDHLVSLVLGADHAALADLRIRALAPLSHLRASTADRLAETLRSWLLHHGRRDAIAAELVVHAQTVRYRMTQLRAAYGEQLNDPQTVLELTIALAIPEAEPPKQQ